jgi:hypothetical protein
MHRHCVHVIFTWNTGATLDSRCVQRPEEPVLQSLLVCVGQCRKPIVWFWWLGASNKALVSQNSQTSRLRRVHVNDTTWDSRRLDSRRNKLEGPTAHVQV